MHRKLTTGVALLALTGGALALTQPQRTGQPGQEAGQPGQRGGQPGQRGGQPGQRDPAQFIERMMERDANGDGKLQRDELPDQIAERFFEAGDTNGDGALDREELLASMSQRPGRGAGQGQPGERGGAAGPNFEGSMRQAGRALAGLRRSELSAETMQRDLQSVQMLQQSLLAAKGGASTAPRSERAQEKFNSDEKFNVAMRMDLLGALRESINLEIALLEGNREAAEKSVGRIAEIQDKGHDVFQPGHDDDHDEAGEDEPAGRRGGGGGRGRGGG